MHMARVAVAMRDEVEKVMRRRENARNFRSNLLPGDKFYPLVEPHPFKFFFGGRDARKSWAFAEALVRRMNKSRIRWLCTRQYQNSIKDSVWRVLADTIERLGMEHRFDVNKNGIANPYTGGEFIFKGLQKPNELKSTEGCDGAWVAEAQDVTSESWEILEPTIRKPGSEIWADFNVTSEDTPTYQHCVLKPPPGAISVKVSWEDNPFLSDVSKAKIKHMQETDPDAFMHVYGGFPKKYAESRIFGGKYVIEGFDESLALRCIREGGRIYYGLDFGFAVDPVALIRYFILDETLYIENEAFGVGVEFAGEMAPGLRPGEPDRGELEQLMDSVPGSRDWPIKGDPARPETISFLRGKGFDVTGAEKWEGCVEDGISYLKSFRRIVIHPRCREMQQEAMLYSFKVDRLTKAVLPVVVDAHNHGWDAIRYGLDGYIQQGGDLGIWARLGLAAERSGVLPARV
jgi:phage terminase large subunit